MSFAPFAHAILAVAAITSAPSAATPDGERLYAAHCAGCHGFNAATRTASIPRLRGGLGRFLCSPEGRAYIVQLPNVSSLSGLDDDQLAAVLNHLVFTLGAGGGLSTAPFTVQEVARARLRPLGPDIAQARRRVLRDHRCSGRLL